MSELLLRKALEHAQEALHRACLVIGSTDGFRGDFDGINEALAIEPDYEYRAVWIGPGGNVVPDISGRVYDSVEQAKSRLSSRPRVLRSHIERHVKAGPWERVEE